ncbi:MAG: hypothetical protein AAGE76_05730 [Pseudomonadota bacterium]
MVRTIATSRHVFVRGKVARRLPDGRLIVRVGGLTFTGRPLALNSATRRQKKSGLLPA